MPERKGGRDLALVQNPATGRYDFLFDDSGNPAFTDTEEHTVLSLELERQGEYWADTTGRRGSRLHRLKLDRKSTRAEIVAITAEALAPAVGDGRLHDVSTAAERVSPGRYYFIVRWRPRDGNDRTLRLSLGS